MEKAILRTLIYADIFDYPLKAQEIQKWLIRRKATLWQAAKVLDKLKKNSKLEIKCGYYFLPKRAGLIGIRKRREEESKSYLRKAKFFSRLLKIIPWIKLVGISGGLALNNAAKADDIYIAVITAKGRLWICRLFILGLLSLVGQRRVKKDTGKKIAGKFCVNILLEEDRLEQKNKDIYVAHEVLQMKVLWQRDGIYSKYLEDNSWAFKFLPNWISDMSSPRMRGSKEASGSRIKYGMTDHFELLAKKFQLSIMQSKQGQERIEDGA